MKTSRLMALLLAGALVLVGCSREVGSTDDGGDAADGDTATADDGEDGDSAEDDGGEGDQAAAAACEVDETDGDLLLYNWAEYIDPALVDAFKEQYGVDVIQDTYTSNEAMVAQIRAGGADYDMIVPSDYMVAIMIEEGLLLELDQEALPNSENIAAEFSDPPYDPGLVYSMPYLWGTTGLGVNTEATGEDPEPTWGWLFDEEMAGQLDRGISMLDDPREAMGAALFYLGYSNNTQSEEELQEAADLIEQAGAWTVTYESDQYPDLLVADEVSVAHGYSGELIDSFPDEQFAYLIPEEGAVIWTDTMAILKEAEHPCTAHTFMNFILDAENGAQLSNWVYYASPNEAATEFLDEELLANEGVYPTEETMQRLQFLENTGEAEILYTDLFTRAQG